MKIYGPYKRKSDGRWYLSIRENGKKTTKSYPKHLMEIHLGRKLAIDETVDHIDRNPDNNDLKNLRILSRAKHAAEDCKRVHSVKSHCKWCKKDIFVSARAMRNCSRQGKAGPFCGKSCAGRYGVFVQLGGKKFCKQKFTKSGYFQRDKAGVAKWNTQQV